MRKITFWSVTQYRLFKACPWAYYLRYILKKPGRPSEAGEKGKATHLALKSIVDEMLKQGGEPLKSTKIYKLIQEACAKEITPELHPKSVGKEIRSMVMGALAKIDFRTFEAVVTEKKFEIPLDDKGHILLAFIDLFMVMEGDMLYLIDYKTGSVGSSEDDIQLGTYAAAAREGGYGELAILGALFPLTTHNLDPVMISKEQSNQVLQRHREAIADVEQRLRGWIVEEAFPATPGLECQCCAYSGECPKGNGLGNIPISMNDITPERVKELAEWHRIASRSLDLVNELLKEYASMQDNGVYVLNGGYFGSKKKQSTEWKLGMVLDLLKAKGVDESVFRNISLSTSELSGYLKSKKYRELGFDKSLKMIGEPKERNLFGYHKGEPMIQTKNEEISSDVELSSGDDEVA